MKYWEYRANIFEIQRKYIEDIEQIYEIWRERNGVDISR